MTPHTILKQIIPEKKQNIIQIELDNIFVHADPKRIQPNGTVYISTAQRGRYVKAVIFEEE